MSFMILLVVQYKAYFFVSFFCSLFEIKGPLLYIYLWKICESNLWVTNCEIKTFPKFVSSSKIIDRSSSKGGCILAGKSSFTFEILHIYYKPASQSLYNMSLVSNHAGNFPCFYSSFSSSFPAPYLLNLSWHPRRYFDQTDQRALSNASFQLLRRAATVLNSLAKTIQIGSRNINYCFLSSISQIPKYLRTDTLIKSVVACLTFSQPH